MCSIYYIVCQVYPMILLSHDVQTDQGNEDDL
jgi:hypothetical protein